MYIILTIICVAVEQETEKWKHKKVKEIRKVEIENGKWGNGSMKKGKWKMDNVGTK
jgi:hypothetical protein